MARYEGKQVNNKLITLMCEASNEDVRVATLISMAGKTPEQIMGLVTDLQALLLNKHNEVYRDSREYACTLLAVEVNGEDRGIRARHLRNLVGSKLCLGTPTEAEWEKELEGLLEDPTVVAYLKTMGA